MLEQLLVNLTTLLLHGDSFYENSRKDPAGEPFVKLSISVEVQVFVLSLLRNLTAFFSQDKQESEVDNQVVFHQSSS